MLHLRLVLLFCLLLIPIKLKAMDFKGEFLFECGPGICTLNLNNNLINKVVEYPGKIPLMTSIAMVGIDKIIISHNACLKQIDIVTGHESELGVGTRPHYLRKHGLLFYFFSDGSSEQLLMRKLHDHHSTQSIMTFNNPLMIGNYLIKQPLVELSADEIVFVGNNLNIWSYNVVSGELKDWGLNNYLPYIYRSEEKQLLCSIIKEQQVSWRLVSTLDLKETTFEIADSLIPQTYLPQNDILLFQTEEYDEKSMTEVYPLYSYNFKTKKIKNLCFRGYMNSLTKLKWSEK